MKQLLVHIGTHKTGTTAIQNALRANKKLLAKHDCTYVDEAYELSRRLKESGLPGAEFEAVKKAFNDLVNRAPGKRVILSSEQFAGTILKNYTDSSFIAERLRAIFPGHKLSVIVYFRRQDRFIESAYTQFIQQGQSWSFDRFRDFADFSEFDWNTVVESYRKYFKVVDIHIFDRSLLAGGDVVIDFFTWLGLPTDRRLRIIQGSNYGFSRTAVEVARVGNSYLDDTAKQHLYTMLQSRDSRQSYDNNPFFSSQEREALLAHYRPANRKLAAVAGANLEDAFPSALTADSPGIDASAMAVDPDASVRLLIDICLQQHGSRRRRIMPNLIVRLKARLKQYASW